MDSAQEKMPGSTQGPTDRLCVNEPITRTGQGIWPASQARGRQADSEEARVTEKAGRSFRAESVKAGDVVPDLSRKEGLLTYQPLGSLSRRNVGRLQRFQCSIAPDHADLHATCA